VLASFPGPVEERAINGMIANELRAHLGRLLSTKEMADWLKVNEKAGAAAAKVDAGSPVPPLPVRVPLDRCELRIRWFCACAWSPIKRRCGPRPNASATTRFVTSSLTS